MINLRLFIHKDIKVAKSLLSINTAGFHFALNEEGQGFVVGFMPFGIYKSKNYFRISLGLIDIAWYFRKSR